MVNKGNLTLKELEDDLAGLRQQLAQAKQQVLHWTTTMHKVQGGIDYVTGNIERIKKEAKDEEHG